MSTMTPINRSIESLLPFFASSISNLVASLPRRAARPADVAGLSGAAGAGLLAGVAIGLLFAPQSGDETRQQLMTSAGSLRERLMSKVKQLAPQLEATSETTTETATARDTKATPPPREAHNGNGRRAGSSKHARA